MPVFKFDYDVELRQFKDDAMTLPFVTLPNSNIVPAIIHEDHGFVTHYEVFMFVDSSEEGKSMILRSVKIEFDLLEIFGLSKTDLTLQQHKVLDKLNELGGTATISELSDKITRRVLSAKDLSDCITHLENMQYIDVSKDGRATRITLIE